jgi:hypothetical protein
MFRDNINNRFKIRELGELRWFLDIRVIRNRSKRRL